MVQNLEIDQIHRHALNVTFVFQYLDPHTTQKCGTIGEKQNPAEVDIDETYHQKYAARIPFEKMDPSLALVRVIINLIKIATNLKFFQCDD